MVGPTTQARATADFAKRGIALQVLCQCGPAFTCAFAATAEQTPPPSPVAILASAGKGPDVLLYVFRSSAAGVAALRALPRSSRDVYARNGNGVSDCFKCTAAQCKKVSSALAGL